MKLGLYFMYFITFNQRKNKPKTHKFGFALRFPLGRKMTKTNYINNSTSTTDIIYNCLLEDSE